VSDSPQHNSKTNDPKVLKLGVGNDLGMGCDIALGFKSQRSQGHVTRLTGVGR